MKDKRVSNEVAELAYEKGIRPHWDSINTYYQTDKASIPVPTQTQLQAVLREDRNIDIVINPISLSVTNKKGGYYFLLFGEDAATPLNNWDERYSDLLEKCDQDVPGHHLNYEMHDKYLFEDKLAFKTYPEALEEALKAALELL
jgi:hypothetical protein